jgi:hypothetical protein
VGLALLCDQPDFELPNGHAGVFAVQAGVKTCAGLQLQHILLVVERPNAGESRVEVTHYGLGAALEHCLQSIFGPAGQCCVNICTQRRLARTPSL